MRKLFYPLFVLGLLVTLGFVYKNYENKKNAIPEIKIRNKNVSSTSEWLNTKASMEGLIDKIRRNPADLKSKLQLAMLYVQEGRTTGDHAYYDEASLILVNQVLAKDANNFDALCVKSTLLLSQHHFSDALIAANNVVNLYPDAAYGYGLLCDAKVELGDYKGAVEAADKMISIRPDLRSYSRVSYLREIHGDYKGAIEAMTMAVKASVTGMEQTEWCRAQLGKLYENVGDFTSAKLQYDLSLAARPDYAYALAGMGRLAKQNKNYEEAINYYIKANESVTDFAFNDELIDLYRLNNQNDEAQKVGNKLIENLKLHANTDAAAPDKGHYADKELAYVYLKMGNSDKALEHATREWNRRPNNIDVNECLAWVYFNKNDLPDAQKFMQHALVTNSQNPVLRARVAQIMK